MSIDGRQSELGPQRYSPNSLGKIVAEGKFIMNQMSESARACKVAKEAHKNQTRWDGSPYFNHILGVVNLVQDNRIYLPPAWNNFDTFDCVVSAAFLHDVVEDTDITVEDLNLKYGFSPLTCDMVECLTKRKGESYFDFIMRVNGSHVFGAKYIKICDITHNMSDANEKEKLGARYAKYELSRYILSYLGLKPMGGMSL